MKFHPTKCKALSLTNQRNILNNLPCTIFNYKLGSVLIDYVQLQVDLGVITVNRKLLWTNQCGKLTKNANSKLTLLMRRCCFSTNNEQKKAFYLKIISSIFEHCSIIWHPVSSNQLSTFDAIQKKAVKWIINGQQFIQYTDLEYLSKLKELSILPIKSKFALNDLILFYKIINCLVPIEHSKSSNSAKQGYWKILPQKLKRKLLTRHGSVC